MQKLILLFTILASYSVVNADVYYGQIINDKISKCIHWNENLTESIAALESGFKSKCELDKKINIIHAAHVFKCGKNNNQLLFTKSEYCETYKSKLISGKKISALDFVPKNIKNKGGYVVIFNKCLLGALKKNEDNSEYQKIWAYCECLANKISEKSEADLKKMNISKFIDENMSSCISYEK